ncbi:MAG: HNH endonuclease, partial [Clostridia bacterium]|nr:HNH endonuclease [Clostridia bacterium]
LERLAAFMRATSWDVTHRIERYAKVLSEIETAGDGAFGESIELTDEEKKEFLSKLNSDIYKMVSNKRNYLILRLDSFVSDGAATYDSKILTIEHVLPQTVATGSNWEKLWPDVSEREQWLHKIGNLVPLTKRHNSQAQNYEFDVKKEKYFSSKAGTTSYALTSQVLQRPKWTPAVVKARQEELIKAYRQNWDL